MKKYIIGLFIVGFVLAPMFSFAQVEDIDPNPDASQCVSLKSNNLRYRSRDANTNGEVSTLQDFLQSKNYLTTEPTGYFGLLTQKAVKYFQKANNINPNGFVGPATKAKIESLTCENIISDTTDPVISGVSGPQSLNVNQTGTWTISASDRNGGNLSYSVVWGDEVSVASQGGGAILDRAPSYQQSATFTHSYSQSGTYSPKFIVMSDNGVRCVMAPCYSGGRASTTLSVKVGNTTDVSSIKIISPINGETLIKGNNKVITWKDNLFFTCPIGAPCARPIDIYDISLYEYNNPCDGPICAAVERPYKAPYTIAKGVSGYSMDWNVGSVNDTKTLVPDGKYKIFICRTGTGVCDTGNDYFKIVSYNLNAPIISGVSGPQRLNVNQTGTWTISASDRNGENLSYSVVWGDEVSVASQGGSALLERAPSYQQSATFTHSYSQSGTYSPKFIVVNADGQSANTTLSVNVGNVTAVPSITVLSPNGGEIVNVSKPFTVTLKSNNAYPAKHYINITDEDLGHAYSLDSLSGLDGITFTQAQINQSSQSVILSIVGSSYNLDVNHNYKIEICVNNVCDKSNNYFRIISSNSVAPVISGVSGPQTLNVNQTGTWTVSASNPNGGNLLYSVNWGDVANTCSSGSVCAIAMSTPQQSATFTHSYSYSGTYTPRFSVINSNGQSAGTSLSVNVTNLSVAPSVTVLSPNGGESFFDGQQVTVNWSNRNFTDNVILGLVAYDSSNVGINNFSVSNLIPNNGTYTFTLPTIATMKQQVGNAILTGAHYKILVSGMIPTNNPPQDLSDNFFSINLPATITGDIQTIKNINLSNQTVNQNSFGTKIGSYIVTNNSSEPVKLTNLTVSMYGETSIPVSVLSNLVVKNNSTILASSNSLTNLNNFSSDLIVSAGFYKQIDIYADIGVTSSGKIQTLLGVNGQGINTGNSFPLTPKESTYGQVITIQ